MTGEGLFISADVVNGGSAAVGVVGHNGLTLDDGNLECERHATQPPQGAISETSSRATSKLTVTMNN